MVHSLRDCVRAVLCAIFYHLNYMLAGSHWLVTFLVTNFCAIVIYFGSYCFQ